MISLTQQNNADAAVHKLLKYLSINIDLTAVSTELEKHPDYPSLLAVSDVLTSFGIETTALRVDFEELESISCPFIAHSLIDGGTLVVVTKINRDKVTFSNDKWNGQRLAAEEFKRQFTGVIMVAKGPENNTAAIAVGRFSFVNRFKIPAVMVGAAVILLSALFYHTNYLSNLNWHLVSLTIFKTVGLTVSILLLMQSIDSNNPLVQVLCQTKGRTNCGAILSSKAAKVFRLEWLSWSEVGFFYFASTWLLTLFGDHSTFMLSTLLVLNVVSLPYTFYSIYYQARVAKQWCTLCCIVQTLLWLEFISLITYITYPTFSKARADFGEVGWATTLATFAICLLTPIILWALLKPLFLKLQQLQPLKQQLRKFKYNLALFNQMLIAQPQYTQPDEDWSIVLGNRQARNVITMVSNPYCQPCSKTHKLLDELLDECDNLQARIVFTARNTDNDIRTQISRHLVALNNIPDQAKIKQALNDWYEQKQKNYETWAKAYPVTMNGGDYEKINHQQAWCEMAEVSATPTMLLNGYRLPDLYQLPDLKYMFG